MFSRKTSEELSEVMLVHYGVKVGVLVLSGTSFSTSMASHVTLVMRQMFITSLGKCYGDAVN